MERPPQGTVTVRGPQRFEEVLAYRGIIAILLVLFHAHQYLVYLDEAAHDTNTVLNTVFSGLRFSGCFFTLSGFLLFLPLARALLSGKPGPTRWHFLRRRLVRIVPLYYIAYTSIWLLSYTGDPMQRLDLLAHLTFTHIFFPQFVFGAVAPAWSLSVEMLFYVGLIAVFPPLNALCRRISPERRFIILILGLIGCTVGSLTYKWWAFAVAAIPLADLSIYYGPFAHLDSFAFGMLIAVVVASGKVRCCRYGAGSLGVVGGGALFTLIALRADTALVQVFYHSLSSAAFALILASTTLVIERPRWVRLIDRRPFRSVGTISYSVYLWHEPALVVALGLFLPYADTAMPALFVVGGVALALASAMISYRLLERPAQRLSDPAFWARLRPERYLLFRRADVRLFWRGRVG
jgi:peptidoglycan/LPS O-acetylase OafA/YrhL